MLRVRVVRLRSRLGNKGNYVMIKWLPDSSDPSILFEVHGHNKLIGMGTLIDRLMTRPADFRLRNAIPVFNILDEVERTIPIYIDDKGYFRFDEDGTSNKKGNDVIEKS